LKSKNKNKKNINEKKRKRKKGKVRFGLNPPALAHLRLYRAAPFGIRRQHPGPTGQSLMRVLRCVLALTGRSHMSSAAWCPTRGKSRRLLGPWCESLSPPPFSTEWLIGESRGLSARLACVTRALTGRWTRVVSPSLRPPRRLWRHLAVELGSCNTQIVICKR
jgi:hypothetical protein